MALHQSDSGPERIITSAHHRQRSILRHYVGIFIGNAATVREQENDNLYGCRDYGNSVWKWLEIARITLDGTISICNIYHIGRAIVPICVDLFPSFILWNAKPLLFSFTTTLNITGPSLFLDIGHLQCCMEKSTTTNSTNILSSFQLFLQLATIEWGFYVTH